MPKIRVLVVEDSLTVRRCLCEALASDPEIEIVGEAADGQTAIEMCRALRPDVVTLDMMLPVMNGLAATEYIMAHCPTPILIISSSTNRGELFKTYDALAAGAVDAVEKPVGDERDDWAQIISAVKLVSRIKVITHLRPRSASVLSSLAVQSPAERRSSRIIGIGASTGGPSAVVTVLREIPSGFEPPILLVLHIGETLGKALADWLDQQTQHRVSYARDGEATSDACGRVVMAPPDRHLEVRDGRLRLTSTPARFSCRPSVDVLFESIAREYGAAGTGCLLTGMGNDGAAGLLEIRRAGGLSLAQDEATSVVYGMPRQAAMIGAAERVLPIGEIGPTLASHMAMNAKEG